MNMTIPIDIRIDVTDEKKRLLESQVRAAFKDMKTEYLLWLKNNGNPIVIVPNYIEGDELLTAFYRPDVKTLFLCKRFFDQDYNARVHILEREVIDLIDHQLKFTSQPPLEGKTLSEFQWATLQDAEELLAKTASAISRIWHESSKPMPTGEYYTKKDAIEAGILHEVLFCREMLEQIHGLKKQKREKSFYKKAERLFEVEFETEEQAKRTLTLAIATIVFGLGDIPEDKQGAATRRIVSDQSKQLSEVLDHIETITQNPEKLSVDEMLEKIFPHLYSHAITFREKVENIAYFFDRFPQWREATKNQDTTQMTQILEAGINKDALDFIRQKECSPEVKELLDKTYALVAGDHSDIKGAHLKTKIDGQTLLQMAIQYELYELADALRKAEEQREKESRLK